MEKDEGMGLVFKDTANDGQYNARLYHLANTFKLYKENKLKFFYPENDNADYSEEEEEILLRARIDSMPKKNLPKDITERVMQQVEAYDVRELIEGDFKLKVIEKHNIYLNSYEEKPIEVNDQMNNRVWGKTMFFSILDSVSKLLKKPS
jgi:hypothetical protein